MGTYRTIYDVVAQEARASVRTIAKSGDELRYTLGVAYAADRADPHRGADGYRDFARADVLRKAAWSYLQKGAKVGLDHEAGTEGAGTVVESYLWPDGAPEWPQDSGYVVKAGDWLLGVQWSPKAWRAIKAGKRRGFSIQGAATRRVPTAAALAALKE